MLSEGRGRCEVAQILILGYELLMSLRLRVMSPQECLKSSRIIHSGKGSYTRILLIKYIVDIVILYLQSCKKVHLLVIAF